MAFGSTLRQQAPPKQVPSEDNQDGHISSGIEPDSCLESPAGADYARMNSDENDRKERLIGLSLPPLSLDIESSSKKSALVQSPAALADGAQATGIPKAASRSPDVSQGVKKAKQQAIMLELFCGSARMTRSFQDEGVEGAVGIDYLRNKSRPVGPSVLLDLTEEHGKSILWRTLKGGRVLAVVMAPPCGTASRARERRLSKHYHGPKPLRTEQSPCGVEGLVGDDLTRVSQANKLYMLCAEVFRYCVQEDIFVVLENPRRSLFWWIPEVNDLLKLPGVFDKEYNACMHGGERFKQQTLRTNVPELQHMAGECDESHEHQPYQVKKGEFSTADEAVYPWQFCRTVARLVCAGLERRGILLGPTLPRRADLRIASGRQPRGKLNPKLMPEFKEVVEVTLPAGFQLHTLTAGKRTCHSDMSFGGKVIPKGSKFLAIQMGGEGPGMPNSSTSEAQPTGQPAKAVQFAPVSTSDVRKRKRDQQESTLGHSCKAKFGVYFTPVEWHEKAKTLAHPVDSIQALTDRQAKMLQSLMSKSKEEVRNFRRTQLEKFRLMADQLEEREEKLHSKMPDRIQRIMEGKKILLTRELMKMAGVNDEGLTSRMVAGFELLGELPETGLFPKQFKPPRISKVDLMRSAAFSQKEAMSKCRSSGDPEIDDAVFAKTEMEEKAGWISKPMTREEAKQKSGPLFVVNRRFGIKQGRGEKTKVRQIDDLSEFQPNATVGQPEKLDLGGVDEMVVLARCMEEVRRGTMIKHELDDGNFLHFRCHSDWSKSMSLRGRTVDLEAAYKQLAISEGDLWATYVAVFNPKLKQAELRQLFSLPFGGTGAVAAFNWASRTLTLLANTLLLIVCSAFFDDFPQLEDEECEDDDFDVFLEFFQLLGWRVARDKLPPFKAEYKILGVVKNLANLSKAEIVVGNTKDRVDEINEDVQNFLTSAALSSGEAASLRGRMGYAYLQCAGKPMAPSMRQLALRAESTRRDYSIDTNLETALRELAWFFVHAPPRTFSFENCNEVVQLYTDGAFEAGSATCGAVVFSPGFKPECFGFTVPKSLVSKWHALGSEHCVAQAEMLPALVAKVLWKPMLCGRRVIHFIDNQSVKEALTKGNTASLASLEILSATVRQEISNMSITWYSRVPSASNLADDPSRLEFGFAAELGIVIRKFSLSYVLKGIIDVL